MNALLWSAAKPITFTAVLVALGIVVNRPRCRAAIWAARAALARRTPPWSGTSDDVFTPAGWDAAGEAEVSVIDGTEALARHWCGMPYAHPESLTAVLDDDTEDALADLDGVLWPEETA